MSRNHHSSAIVGRAEQQLQPRCLASVEVRTNVVLDDAREVTLTTEVEDGWVRKCAGIYIAKKHPES